MILAANPARPAGLALGLSVASAFAASGEEILVTDPSAGVIHVVEIEVDGQTNNFAAFGAHGAHH